MAEINGDRAAVVDWGCGGVWELRETRVVLKAGSARAGRLRRCEATVSFELAGVRAGGGDVLGVLGRERARQRGESETGLLLVLRRARVGELRLFCELSTAKARWRPRSSSGWRGEGSRAPARGGVGPEGRGGAACGGGVAGGGLPALLSSGGAALPGGRGSREGERGGRRRPDLFAIFEKFRDPTVKQK